MAYIVGDACIDCKYTDCVAVCPVECFYEGANALVIHPDECIDCGACEPECPTTAIFEESALPDDQNVYVEINAVMSGAKKSGDAEVTGWPQKLVDAIQRDNFAPWPQISDTKEALSDADEMASKEGKLASFDPAPGS